MRARRRVRTRIWPRHRDLAALCAMPRRDAMSPPKLPRDAPVMDVFHPAQIRLLVHLGHKTHCLLAVRVEFDCSDGLVGQRLNLEEPLHREPRLHNRLAAVAVAHVVHVILDPGQQPLLFQVRHNLLTRSEPIQTRVRAALLIDVRGRVHHVDRRQTDAARPARNRWDRAPASPSPRRCRTRGSPNRPVTIGISRSISGRRSFLPCRCV